MAVGSKLASKLHPGSWAEFVYEISIGAVVGATHSLYFVTRWWYQQLVRPIASYYYEEETISSNPSQILQVIGVGYGRTGTVSAMQLLVPLTPNA